MCDAVRLALEPGPRTGDRKAFNALWIAIAIVLLVAVLVVYAALR